MSETPILPTADAVLSKVLERFCELRPNAVQHVNLRTGVYWHPFLGYRAQTAAALARLLTLIKDNRLTTAEGRALLDYVASEYAALPESDSTNALGELSLTRTSTTTAGDIPAFTRFARRAGIKTQIPLQAATYETLVNAHFDVGQATVGPIPVRAVTIGEDSNHPIRTDSTTLGVTGQNLFDSTISVSDFGAAGGSTTGKPSFDAYVRKYAKAFAAGQYGPTSGASRYGALRGAGVRNILVYDVPEVGTQKILVADESWASSSRWAGLIEQGIYDADLVGFGCKVSVDTVRNVVISVDATVKLRDKNYAAETTAIDAAIAKAVRSYFDDRRDWNVWKTDALKAAISRCHNKILSCSGVTVKGTAGETLTESPTPDYSEEQFHYYLGQNAMRITYTGPS